MKIKFKNLFIIWVIATICLTALFISCFNAIYIGATDNNLDKVAVSESIKEVEVVEKEVEVEYEVPVDKEVYKFPFKTEDMGTRVVKGVSNDTMPTKEYPKMRSNEDITVFANENTFPEGTLLYIDGVGIRQVQTVMTNENKVFIYFNNSNDAVNFGEKEVKIFKILE